MPSREPRIRQARTLRQESTRAELTLWLAVKNRRLHGLKFRRQHPRGAFVLDFYCAEVALVVELDGGQHAELTAERDVRRTEYLERQGLYVLRFWNNEVLENLDGVLCRIAETADERRGKPSPQA